MEPVAPKPIWAMALLGLSPFPVAASIYAYGPASQAAHSLGVLLTWSGVVMGFLGGIRWGVETGTSHPRWNRLAASTVSPLAGWGLMTARPYIGDPWVITGFLVAFILQWLFDQSGPEAPARYPRMMTILTLGACVSLALALQTALRM